MTRNLFNTCILLACLLAACTNAKKEEPGIPPAVPDTAVAPKNQQPLPAAADTLKDWMGIYETLDENHSGEKDTAAISNWWKQKLAQVERYGNPENLFSTNGGGPHGSEWNPLNDLYIVVTTGKKITGEKTKLLLNNKLITTVKWTRLEPTTKTGTIWYAVIPYQTWSAALHATTINDLAFIYGKEKADSMIRSSPGAPFTQTVTITAQVQATNGFRMEHKGIFLAAYGE